MSSADTHFKKNPFVMDPFATAQHRNIIRRHKTTLEFVGERTLGRILDIGERNPLTLRIEEKYGVSVRNTVGDLDSTALTGRYDTVLCFEVIEHLMNPLQLLLNIHNVLEDDGTLFLSTPKHKPHFFWDKHHYTELDEFRLKTLVTRAGFEIVAIDCFRTMPFWWYFTGFRPLLRIFFNKVFILELRKARG